MKILNYINSCAVALTTGLLALTGCADNSIDSTIEKPITPDDIRREGYLDADAKIRLRIGAPSLVQTSSSYARTATRGSGTVGDLAENTAENVWHGDTIYVYAVHALTEDLTRDISNADAEIPTYLMGGHDSQQTSELEIPFRGTMAIAPSGTNGGEILFPHLDETRTMGYYPINGAYSFLSYYVSDAVVTDPVATPEKITMEVTYNGTQDILLGQATSASLTDDQIAKLGSEGSPADPEKAFSSYAARRDVHPNMVFHHQLSRLSFFTVAGNDDAKQHEVGDDLEPQFKIDEYDETRKYQLDDIFAYEGRVYMVIQSFPSPFTSSELFGTQAMQDMFIKNIDFNFERPFDAGDIVHSQGRLYTMNKRYIGIGYPDWTLLKRYIWTEYTANSSFSDGIGISYQGRHWVTIDDITADENTSWEAIAKKVVPYALGVYVTEVKVKNVINHGVIEVAPKGITFTTDDVQRGSKSDFYLMQRRVDSEGNIRETDPLVPLEAVAPLTTDSKNPTRVGESMMVAPYFGAYKADVTICEYVNKRGDIVAKEKRSKVYNNLSLTCDEMMLTGFEAEKNYNIVIKVFALEDIRAEVTLTGWEEGGDDINISPDEDDEEIDEDHIICFYGCGETLPESFGGSRRFGLPLDGGIVTVTDTEASTIHWVAIPDSYRITSWKSQKLSPMPKDYVNDIKVGTQSMVMGVMYSLYYINLDNWQDTYSLTIEKVTDN